MFDHVYFIYLNIALTTEAGYGKKMKKKLRKLAKKSKKLAKKIKNLETNDSLSELSNDFLLKAFHQEL